MYFAVNHFKLTSGIIVTGSHNPKNYNKIDKRNYIASIEQLKTASDWSPKIFLEEGIQRLVRYYSIGKIND